MTYLICVVLFFLYLFMYTQLVSGSYHTDLDTEIIHEVMQNYQPGCVVQSIALLTKEPEEPGSTRFFKISNVNI